MSGGDLTKTLSFIRSSPRKVEDLRPDPKNPRRLHPENQRRLAASLAEFGELGCIVYNRRLKRLVGGHQRMQLLPPDSEVVIQQEFDPPLKDGTASWGFIEAYGERFFYREVDWDRNQHALASIAANNANMQGEFDFPKLAGIVADLEARGVSAKKAGYDEADIQRMLNWTPRAETPAPDETAPNEPASTTDPYLANAVRSIVLYFGDADYAEVLDKLERIAQAQGLPDYTAVVLHLLDHYERCKEAS